MNVHGLAYWMNERQMIYHRRQAGEKKPWTTDPVLQQYKFCNVYRELDTVTQWLDKNWRQPYADHPHLWFAMCLARQINWPDTLEEIGFPERWEPEKVRYKMLARELRREKVWTGAYMLRGNVQKGGDKPRYMVDNLSVLYEAQEKPTGKDTLQSYHTRLMTYPGWGSFLAAQAVADLKYTRWLEQAPDWWDWAGLGPGSQRGLNRIFQRPLDFSIKQTQAVVEMQTVREHLYPLLDVMLHPDPIHLQDIQNCLCEYDKWERVNNGEGRPRSKYAGVS